ncbi:MAG: type II secretion system protein GspK [Pseudomonadota bacterium]|nr:type II secretion system protein GspK [Pseudomonadota bacterium]
MSTPFASKGFTRTGLPRRPASSARGRRRDDRRGIALIVVIGTIMFLTALVTDISFGARIRFLTATHERDEAKAYWLSVTGVNLYRLVLVANKQMGDNSMLAELGLGDSLWQTIPFINTGLLRMFISSDGDVEDEDLETFEQTGEVSEEVREESVEETTRFGSRNFLDFDGDFMAAVEGEECGININKLATRSADDRPEDTTTGKQLVGLMSGEENDQWLRDRSLERLDLIGNLADWVDADSVVASGKGGYEDDFYNSQPSPYLAKNAAFDTLAELRLVEGWQDEVFDRWGQQLTIYGNGKINITCADDTVMAGMLQAHLTPRPTDSEAAAIIALVRDYMATASFKSGSDFVKYLQDQGFSPDDELASEVGVKTQVFTITSTGTVGDATAQITAVVDFTSSSSGTIRYWRVD